MRALMIPSSYITTAAVYVANLVQIGGGRVDRLIRRGAKRVTDRRQLGQLCPILEVDLSCAHQDERFGVEGEDI